MIHVRLHDTSNDYVKDKNEKKYAFTYLDNNLAKKTQGKDYISAKKALNKELGNYHKKDLDMSTLDASEQINDGEIMVSRSANSSQQKPVAVQDLGDKPLDSIISPQHICQTCESRQLNRILARDDVEDQYFAESCVKGNEAASRDKNNVEVRLQSRRKGDDG